MSALGSNAQKATIGPMKHPASAVMEEDEEPKKKFEKSASGFLLNHLFQFSWPKASLQLCTGLRRPLDTNYASNGGAKNFCNDS